MKIKQDTRKIISHVRRSDMEIQLNEDHQHGVAELASKFVGEFGMGDCGFIMGKLHDKGKEQTEWQKYSQGVTGFNKEYVFFKYFIQGFNAYHGLFN